MKITKRQLRRIIREEYSRVLKEAHGYFDLDEDTWDPSTNTEKDLEAALQMRFDQVAGDLGTEEMADDGFYDHAGMMMHDARVPSDMIDQAKTWLESGKADRGEPLAQPAPGEHPTTRTWW